MKNDWLWREARRVDCCCCCSAVLSLRVNGFASLFSHLSFSFYVVAPDSSSSNLNQTATIFTFFA